MVIFQVYPNLKHQGGAEKLVLSIAEYLSTSNEVYILSEDHNPVLPKGVKHVFVPLKSPVQLLAALFKLRLLIRKYEPDIIHSHHRMPTMLLSLLRKGKRFRLIHTAHNTFFNKRIFGKSNADKYIAVGKEVEKNLLGFFRLPSSKVTTIINGVPKVETDATKRSSLKNTAVVVGRLSEQKGHKYLFEAWKQVLQAKPEAKLLVIGDGELRGQLQKQASQLGITNNIEFLGFRKDAADWMNKAEFVILPSLWEGLPLTVLEAFSVQKTVVATGVDGTKEVVLNRETGLLVEPRNPESLSNAIIELYTNFALRKYMEEKAYSIFLKKYTIGRMLSNYEELITQLIK